MGKIKKGYILKSDFCKKYNIKISEFNKVMIEKNYLVKNVYHTFNGENYIKEKEKIKIGVNVNNKEVDNNIDKIRPLQAELYDDFEGIVVVIDGNTFTQQDYQIIQQLPAIFQDSGEIGEFELGNLKINIGSLETFERDFIFIENSHNEKN